MTFSASMIQSYLSKVEKDCIYPNKAPDHYLAEALAF